MQYFSQQPISVSWTKFTKLTYGLHIPYYILIVSSMNEKKNPFSPLYRLSLVNLTSLW